MPRHPTRTPTIMNDEFIDPATVAVIRARRERQTLIAGGGTAFLIIAGLVTGLHYEQPFLAHLLGLCPSEPSQYRCQGPMILNIGLGVLCGSMAFPLVIYLFRFMPVVPTIKCLNCKGVGWIHDLEPNGACPRCEGRRFDAEIVTPHVAAGGSVDLLEQSALRDVDGDELLVRMRANEKGFV